MLQCNTSAGRYFGALQLLADIQARFRFDRPAAEQAYCYSALSPAIGSTAETPLSCRAGRPSQTHAM